MSPFLATLSGSYLRESAAAETGLRSGNSGVIHFIGISTVVFFLPMLPDPDCKHRLTRTTWTYYPETSILSVRDERYCGELDVSPKRLSLVEVIQFCRRSTTAIGLMPKSCEYCCQIGQPIFGIVETYSMSTFPLDLAWFDVA